MNTTPSTTAKRTLALIATAAVAVAAMYTNDDAHAGGTSGSGTGVPSGDCNLVIPDGEDEMQNALLFCDQLEACGTLLQAGTTYGACVTHYSVPSPTSGPDNTGAGDVSDDGITLTCEDSDQFGSGYTTCSEDCGNQICESQWELDLCAYDCAPCQECIAFGNCPAACAAVAG